jgi:dienelactone hydrolase
MKFFVTLLLIALSLRAIAPHSYGQSPDADGLTAKAKRLVELMAKGDFSAATADFDNAMKSVLPADKLQEAWDAVVTSAGAFKRQAHAKAAKGQQYEIVFVTCQFERADMDVKVVFDKEARVTGLFFVPAPPPYADEDSFEEKAATVGSGEWALPAALTLPRGRGPFPAVVLVHGSGPHDRDETHGPNKPFRDLAWGLATRGIAVLRYDKRTKVHGAKFESLRDGFTVKEEAVDDALAAVALLRGVAEVDARKIFVLGHSLGGILAPRIGRLDPRVAGLIILAAPSSPGDSFIDLAVEQMTYIYSLDDVISDREKADLDYLKAQAARAKDPALAASPREWLLGVPAAYWLDLRGYSPPAVAAGLKQRLLILQGERDYQVTMREFQGWKRALSSRRDARLKSYPKLNHLFIEGEGKIVPAEYGKAGHVAPYVIEEIAEWIKKK